MTLLTGAAWMLFGGDDHQELEDWEGGGGLFNGFYPRASLRSWSSLSQLPLSALEYM